jgi:uncharacterized membrane protein
MTITDRGLFYLLLLNLGLQAFDGLATYVGLHAGFGEANPILAGAIATIGPAAALIAAKLVACGFLAVVWVNRESHLAGPGFAITALVYATCSFAPWSAALAHAHLL